MGLLFLYSTYSIHTLYYSMFIVFLFYSLYFQSTFVYINPINLRLPLTGTDPINILYRSGTYISNINILLSYRSGTVPFRYIHIIISEYRSGTVPFRHEIIILHYLTRLPGDFAPRGLVQSGRMGSPYSLAESSPRGP